MYLLGSVRDAESGKIDQTCFCVSLSDLESFDKILRCFVFLANSCRMVFKFVWSKRELEYVNGVVMNISLRR